MCNRRCRHKRIGERIMNTPICDFVRKYINSRPQRLHMPGHKGNSNLGFEPFDITEIDGADDLFHPQDNGIIAQSEENASRTFGFKTLYSTQGSTLCIQAMLYLIRRNDIRNKRETKILAGRNSHKAFINAAALIGIDVEWIFPQGGTYHSCDITPSRLEYEIIRFRPTAVYLTYPDYLGNMPDVGALSEVCKKHGVLLAVDGAHGAYLKFLPKSLHPIDLGADICCSSAHKTLPVITGGAYLHISAGAPQLFFECAKKALSLFASSSPSYLILQSLDAMNDKTAEFSQALTAALPKISALKARLVQHGFELMGDEPLKITVAPKSFGYTGEEIASILKKDNIYTEFYDSDFIVFMLSPHNINDAEVLTAALTSIPQKEKIDLLPPRVHIPIKAAAPRVAIFSDSEALSADKCLGRICAATAITCPPAIPPIIGGEYVDEKILKILKYYKIDKLDVMI